MNMLRESELELEPRKLNRRRREEQDRDRPVVHGALPYLGHRPNAKHEHRRLSNLVRQARKRSS
jgi:hypothetical protein